MTDRFGLVYALGSMLRLSLNIVLSLEPLTCPAFRRLRLACCLLTCLAVTPVTSQAAAAEAAANALSYRFAIAAGPLDSAIEAFSHVTGSRVMVPDGASLAGLSSGGVTGVYTADQALAILVSGTGLQSRLTGVGAYALEVRIATEGIQVEGLAAHADRHRHCHEDLHASD